MAETGAPDPEPLKPADWTTFSDEKLLEVRMCDLGLTIAGTELEPRIAQLDAELAARSLVFRPYYWLSDEWFTPDGVPGIAIPFYLAHPRLMQLERKMIIDVEGGTWSECMSIMRHEAGHVVQHSYQLHRKRRWQQLFGPSLRRSGIDVAPAFAVGGLLDLTAGLQLAQRMPDGGECYCRALVALQRITDHRRADKILSRFLQNFGD